MKKTVLSTAVVLVCLIMVAATSVEEERLRQLVSLSGFLKTRAVGEFSYKNFVEGAVDGMLQTLDPHSTFMNEEAYQRMQEDQKGRFYGIGMIISRRNNKITVVSPMANTPAGRIGLRAGDIIYEIDGESTEDFGVTDAVNRLRGEKNTEVEIAIKRPGVKDLLRFTVKREEIPERSVEYAFMMEDGTGYILLKNFGERTAPDMDEALAELKKEGMKRLVLDLRNNPGGLLNAAVYVSDLFLPVGDDIVSIKGRTERDQQSFVAEEEDGYENLPLVVLINRGSASGSEIVAGAIQDNDRGLVVGQTSWGKGLVQSVFMVDKNQALALTTAKYYTPSGRCIQRDYSRSFADYFNPRLQEERAQEEERPVFHTLTGRPVTGGGGIVPDVEVEMGTLNEFLVNLRFRTSAFFRFAVAYAKEHPTVSREFRADDTVISSFKNFLKQEDIEYTDKEFKENLSYIRTTLEQEILSNHFGLEAGTRRFLSIDEQYQEAVRSFEKAEKLHMRSKGKKTRKGDNAA